MSNFKLQNGGHVQYEAITEPPASQKMNPAVTKERRSKPTEGQEL